MTRREPAWRMLASEFNRSVEEERGANERSASFLLSPFGARANRVLLAGDLEPPEQIGKDASMPFWRSRLHDPTGVVSVTAGGFQPRAMAALRAVESSTPSLVVGKAHLYRGRDGVAYPSVRVEYLRSLFPEEFRTALAEALEQTLGRLELLESLSTNPSRSDDEIVRSGVSPSWVLAARSALARYGPPGRDPSREMLRPVLGALGAVQVGERSPPSSVSSGAVTVRRALPPPPRHAPSVSERAEEGAFLDLVDSLSEESMDGYADLKDILQRAEGRGLGAEKAEELVNRLEESGTLEEPIVGKLRRA